MIDQIHWLGHASFRINTSSHEDGMVIYIDPWELPENSTPADIILISHEHHDHCSPEDIQKIMHQDTLIIGNQRVAEAIDEDIHVIRPWTGALNHQGVSIRAMPAYTIHKASHAQAYGGLGYLISMMRYDIYFAGDTDLIPEMEKIGCDIALLPVGGSTTMNYEEAAKAVQIIKPQYAIPMHYGREIPGSKDDGRLFCQLVSEPTEAVELSVENPHFLNSIR